MLAFAIVSVLAAIASAERGAALVSQKKLLLLPLVHLAAGALATPARARWALRLFVAGMAATACVAMFLFLVQPHAGDARLRSTGHYMTFAGLLGLAWPPAAVAAIATPGRGRVLYALVAIALAAALLLGFTRSAWIGSVVAATAILARVRPRVAFAVPLAAVLALAVLPHAYRERALSSFDPHHPFNAERLRMWDAGVEIWRDNPWLGVGPVDLRTEIERRGGGSRYGHLHDNWIHIAATRGGLGLLAFGWLMLAFGRIAWRAARATGPPELVALATGIWGSFWAFQVMGVFEWNFGDVEVTIALCFLLGSGLAAATSRSADAAAIAARAGREMSA
jgi:O-antigen ligase